MVFGLFQKKRSNKSNKRTNRKLRSKTAKRRRSRRVRGGYNAPLGEAYPGGAMEAGADPEMEKFMVMKILKIKVLMMVKKHLIWLTLLLLLLLLKLVLLLLLVIKWKVVADANSAKDVKVMYLN